MKNRFKFLLTLASMSLFIGIEGVGAIASWSKHFLSLGSYNFFNNMEEAVDVRRTTDKKQYYADRRRDALKYGSGRDYQKEGHEK